MPDMEKVIYNLGIISVCCKNRQNIKAYDEIDREMYADWEEIIENALAVLQEQEAKIEQLNRFVNGFSRDAMPVVRCKDCIHYRHYGLSEETVSECTIDHCENPDKEWFCADGERQEGR